jgi:hypothetical protein
MSMSMNTDIDCDMDMDMYMDTNKEMNVSIIYYKWQIKNENFSTLIANC